MSRLSHQECVRLLATAAEEIRSVIASFADSVTLAEIDSSIKEAKTASSGDLPNNELHDLAYSATQLTGRAELYSRGLFLHESDRETALGQLSSAQLKSVRDVADVAARSLRAATGDIENANIECREGVSWAYALAERIGDNNLFARIEALVDSARSNLAQETGNIPMHPARRWWAFWEWLPRSAPPGDR